MKLHFYGADCCVTGSCHCLEINGKKILVDCGLQQGRDELDNRYLAFAPGNIDILLVTHAHIDHTGRIPLLVKNGFHGRILTTRLTADLMKIMLLDSAHIQESDAEYENRKGERAGREHVDPLYTEQDALDVFKYVTTCEYKEKVDLCEGVSAVFTDAGHLLGSASITLELEENGVHKTIVFSGDIGNVDQPIIRDPQLLKKADYVVTVSYTHLDVYKRQCPRTPTPSPSTAASARSWAASSPWCGSIKREKQTLLRECGGAFFCCYGGKRRVRGSAAANGT